MRVHSIPEIDSMHWRETRLSPEEEFETLLRTLLLANEVERAARRRTAGCVEREPEVGAPAGRKDSPTLVTATHRRYPTC